MAQVEVLYEAFPDIDKDIDNRAYAYPNGEASCGAVDPFARGTEFQVSHRLSLLLSQATPTLVPPILVIGSAGLSLLLILAIFSPTATVLQQILGMVLG